MKKIIKTLFLGTLLVGFASLTGCENTMSGFGKDMQQNGKKIEKSVDGKPAHSSTVSSSTAPDGSTTTTTSTTTTGN